MCGFELLFPQGIYPIVGLLGHMVILFLVFEGMPLLFFIVVVPIYIRTQSVRGCPSLHKLCSIYCL